MKIRSIRLGRAPNCSSLGNVVNVLAWSQVAVTTIWAAAEAWKARRSRDEPGGGQTHAVDDPPALVRTAERNGAPHEAHVQVSRACAMPCPSCHVDPSPDGPTVPVAVLEQRFAALAARGVFHAALGGGEALAHPQLADVARAARAQGLSIGLTTSGRGRLDPALAFDQVNVSLDGLGDDYVSGRGYDGANDALRAIRWLAERGANVGVNIVLRRDSFDSLSDTVSAAVAAGARDIHLLRLKPAGRGVATYEAQRLAPAQALDVWPRLLGLIDAHPGVSFRVDCAMTPFLAAHGVSVDRMRAFGWTGCHGGDALVALDVDGHCTPCSFVRAPVSPQWRERPGAAPCHTCDYADICRGGCHAVAQHTTGALFAPDPECPLVAAAS